MEALDRNVEAVIHVKCVCVPQRSCSRDGCRGVGSPSDKPLVTSGLLQGSGQPETTPRPDNLHGSTSLCWEPLLDILYSRNIKQDSFLGP